MKAFPFSPTRLAAFAGIACLFPIALADTLVVTFENGERQTIELRQPKAKISRIEFSGKTSTGTGTSSNTQSGSTTDAKSKETTTFEHDGKPVNVPLGERAFADKVVSIKLGNPAPNPISANPKNALGLPDYKKREDREDTYTSLGKGGSLTLQFTKVYIVDGPGPDIYIFEIGAQVEPTLLEISSDGRKWIELGRISGGSVTVDIAGKGAKGARYSYVRLTDVNKPDGGKQQTGGAPGPDIDTVAALNAEPR